MYALYIQRIKRKKEVKINYQVVFAIVLLIFYKSKKTKVMLTKNFSYDELIHSDKAIELGVENIPNAKQLKALIGLTESILQPLRNAMNFAINISSGFRSPKVNSAVGGSPTSDHLKGQAADLQSGDNAKMFYHIKNHMLFDQLIWEYGNDNQPEWVHVSFDPIAKDNKSEVLRMTKDGISKF